MRLIVAIIIGVTRDECLTLCVRTLSKCMSTTMRLEWTEHSRPAVCLVSVGEHSIPSLERGCEYPNEIRCTTLSPLVRLVAAHSPKEYTSREKAPSSRGSSNNQRLTADQRKRCVNDVLIEGECVKRRYILPHFVFCTMFPRYQDFVFSRLCGANIAKRLLYIHYVKVT